MWVKIASLKANRKGINIALYLESNTGCWLIEAADTYGI